MCLQILIRYGESTALVAILQAQNHKSEIKYDLSPDNTNIMYKGSGSPACNCESFRWGLTARAHAISIAGDPDLLSEYGLKNGYLRLKVIFKQNVCSLNVSVDYSSLATLMKIQ